MNMENLLNRVNENISLVVGRSGELLPGLYRDAMLNSGKRLRTKIYFSFSQDASEKSVKIATAIEILHAATLIHDDILDNSKLRRGKPALYIRHGIPLSLLYGDYLFSTAFSLIAELDDIQIYKQMTYALREVLMGEMIENLRRRDIALTKEEYLSIIEKKSGFLFGLACRLGAMIKGWDEEIIEKSYKFGLNTGMAYQIMDDYSDYFGQDDSKDRFKDLKEGLVTLPLIYLLQKCSDKEKERIVTSLNNEALEKNHIKDIVSLMERYDVPELVFGDIGLFIEKAKAFLPKGISQASKNNFDILSWIEDKINHAKKEYCNSGRRVCRS